MVDETKRPYHPPVLYGASKVEESTTKVVVHNWAVAQAVKNLQEVLNEQKVDYTLIVNHECVAHRGHGHEAVDCVHHDSTTPIHTRFKCAVCGYEVLRREMPGDWHVSNFTSGPVCATCVTTGAGARFEVEVDDSDEMDYL